MRRLPACVLVVFSMVTNGCGVAEYEEKMLREQKRQDLVDEQAQFLADPAELTVTPVSGSEAPAPEIFFRMPRGISPKPNARVGEMFRHDPLAPPRPKPGVRPPPPPLFLDMYTAVLPPGEMKEFVEKAQQAFQRGVPSEFTKVTKPRQGRPPMEYLTATFHDNAAAATSYIVYIPQTPLARVALVFHTYKDKASNTEVTKAIDLCLQSLAIGPDASAARQNYKP